MTGDLTTYLERSASTDLPAMLRAKEGAKRRMNETPTKENIEAFRKVRDEVDKATAVSGEGRLLCSPQARG